MEFDKQFEDIISSQKAVLTRNRENIRTAGEVFTPDNIVMKMIDLIPDGMWKNPAVGYLEPTCGNGQFLVRMLVRRLKAGVHLNDALNTLIGMDISEKNILDSHKRIYGICVAQLKNMGYSPNTKEWERTCIEIAGIVRNNIFKVNDSLEYINSGKFAKKKYFRTDPNGENAVLTKSQRMEKLKKISENFYSDTKTLWVLSQGETQ